MVKVNTLDNTAYFNGNKIKLTGEFEELYGGIFNRAYFMDRSRKGESVLVVVENKQRPLDRILD